MLLQSVAIDGGTATPPRTPINHWLNRYTILIFFLPFVQVFTIHLVGAFSLSDAQSLAEAIN